MAHSHHPRHPSWGPKITVAALILAAALYGIKLIVGLFTN